MSQPTLILLVENEQAHQETLSRGLRKQGYEVVVAEDGMQALERAREVQPQLIVMALELPVMDGWEATRRLKADPETSRIPVIALTADAGGADTQRAEQAGCDDYDTKPVHLRRLYTKVRFFLDQGGK